MNKNISPSPTPGANALGFPVQGWYFVLFLGVATFVAHFLLLTQFGLYEDDYFYTLPVFGWDWPTWWAQVQDAVLHPIQGRPLNHAVRRTFFFLTLNHGGLQSAYLVSWALITVNAVLVFSFVRRTLSFRAAIVAALVFIVYPIDTSRQMLMHQSDLHFGALILLVALNLYANGWRVVAFVVAALGLINYESFYLPFLAAPLLLASRRQVTWQRLLVHVTAFFAIAACVLLTRKLLGESRATDMVGGLGEVVGKMLAAGPIGVWQGLKSIGLRPIDAFFHAAPYAWTLGLGLGILSVWWVTRPIPPESKTNETVTISPLWWIAAGAAMAWLVSYLLSFRADYYPPIISIGRLTAVHAPGTFGAAMCAAVIAELASRVSVPSLRAIAAIIFGGLIGFSAAFGIEIQRSEYAAHWAKQVAFYRSIVELAGDLRDGELLVLDGEGDASVLPITPGFPRFGTVNYSPLSFARFTKWPVTWRNPPRIAVLWNECPVQPVEEGLALFTPPWRYQPRALPTTLEKDMPVAINGRFIYLTALDGALRRISGPVQIHGHWLNSRGPSESEVRNISSSPLFQTLAKGFDPALWFTLRDARNYPR